MDNERKTLKDELNEEFTDDYIEHAGLLIHKLAERFYEEIPWKVRFTLMTISFSIV